MTVKETIEKYKGQYADFEVNKYTDYKRHRIHTDFIRGVDPDMCMNAEVDCALLMNEEEYANSVLANDSTPVDFEGWFDDPDARILVIMLSDGQ